MSARNLFLILLSAPLLAGLTLNPATAVLAFVIMVSAIIVLFLWILFSKQPIDPDSLLPTAVLKATNQSDLNKKYTDWMALNSHRKIHSVRWPKPNYESLLRRALGPIWPNHTMHYSVRIKYKS